MQNKIFIQIASYRDPELIPTVLDLFENAKNPDNLDVVVAWQHDSNESIFPIKNLIKTAIDIPFTESRGVCWARRKLQDLYKNQTYTLQLDSHHRFVKNWDDILIDCYLNVKTKNNKPIISTYLPNYDVITNELSNELWKINPYKFLEDGTLIFCPVKIENVPSNAHPILSRFLSAHFLFTSGEFCKVVKYDPEYYFFGEEISMSAKAFTHGYDIYCPTKHIAYHNYNRKYRYTHWEDNPDKWKELDAIANKKYKLLFLPDVLPDEKSSKNKIINTNGIGKIRSIEEYIKFSKLDFKNRQIL
jgi:Glycosyltransferase (GlcNAc)